MFFSDYSIHLVQRWPKFAFEQSLFVFVKQLIKINDMPKWCRGCFKKISLTERRICRIQPCYGTHSRIEFCPPIVWVGTGQPFSKNVVWSFHTKNRQDQSLPSHVYGRIWPYSIQFLLWLLGWKWFRGPKNHVVPYFPINLRSVWSYWVLVRVFFSEIGRI